MFVPDGVPAPHPLLLQARPFGLLEKPDPGPGPAPLSAGGGKGGAYQ